ncbi:MAG TPA: GNAT family N-acetyltransferase [Solirubrobacteraceae bacterium]|nr:GNAT family N-acetyltransferase [Solirubrobacteraceae bacterium]
MPEIAREGPECVTELRPLWLAVRDHHHEVAPHFGDVWEEEESWRLRRAHHETVLNQPGAFVLVAREAGRPVGYALVTLRGPSPTWREPAHRGELEVLSVLAAYRGQGLGRALVEGCYEELAAEGIDTMTLRVVADNAPARAFYEALGFDPWVVELRGTRRGPRG